MQLSTAVGNKNVIFFHSLCLLKINLGLKMKLKNANSVEIGLYFGNFIYLSPLKIVKHFIYSFIMFHYISNIVLNI